MRTVWTDAWLSLMNKQQVPEEVLTIEKAYSNKTGKATAAETLKAYRFSHMTFVHALTQNETTETGPKPLTLDSMLRFLFINEGPGLDSNNMQGTLGIFIAAYADPDISISAEPTCFTFNFSAPCPPTCVGDLPPD